MEFNKETFLKLTNLVNDAKKNKYYELEARFWGKKLVINEENYNKVFQKFTFSKENNGYGYNYEMKNMLDVILDKNSIKNDYQSIRMTINGSDNIKKYWLTSQIEGLNPIFIEKEKLDKIDEENYNIRFSLSSELPQNNLLEKNKNLLVSHNFEKVYRLKNRYSIKTDDGLFLIDMTSTKMGYGNSFKESNTIKDNLKYEIEIEFIGNESELDSEIIIKKLLEYCEIILKILQNTEILLTTNLINKIKDNYNNLTKIYNKNIFIAADAVTIHRDNLIKNSNIKNILNKYAVTLKADGERYFLIVIKSDKEEENGKIFIFNKAFNYIDTGYKDNEWTNTLIECEYIEGINERDLYMYDILFSKGEDIRKRYLIDIKKDLKIVPRLHVLETFLKSVTRKPIFSENKCIKIKTKKYIQSIRNDGTDIFNKVKDIWESRKYSSFNVDGIIFVPIYEYYPLKGGQWRSLFKWKPPELNTIDFLIKVIKDDNGIDVKSPFIKVIDRLDGKKETILKQYKTIQLYVSGYKNTFNKNTNGNVKSIRKKTPVIFNPYGNDNKNSQVYNIAKIILDDDEKMYSFNLITNEKEEIYDNIIVEFSYDLSKEDGFKWVPHKFRKDKTELLRSGEEMYGNSETTAIDVFKAINNPVTEEMITTGNIPIVENGVELTDKPYYVRQVNDDGKRKRLPYQNFHNRYIKVQLLYFSSPTYIYEYKSGSHGKILDLCCGNGADFNKIRDTKYAELVGMDIDYDNIKEAQERFKYFPIPKPRAYYVKGDASKLIFPEQASGSTDADKIYTKKYIPAKYLFDTISLQFCFHYFFESEITLRTVIQNMNDNLKIGGFVIGTTFDGSRIYESLKNTDSVSGKTSSGEIMWKIDKKYSKTKLIFNDKKPNFGKQIDVLVKTIGNVWPEYLVNFEYLDKIMTEYGFSKIFVKPFKDFYEELQDGKNLMDLNDKDLEQHIKNAKDMSEEEKVFSFFSSSFMYKKEKNTPDSLLKKLMDLMEKRDKLKGKDIYKVDKDTEHFIENMDGM